MSRQHCDREEWHFCSSAEAFDIDPAVLFASSTTPDGAFQVYTAAVSCCPVSLPTHCQSRRHCCYEGGCWWQIVQHFAPWFDCWRSVMLDLPMDCAKMFLEEVAAGLSFGPWHRRALTNLCFFQERVVLWTEGVEEETLRCRYPTDTNEDDAIDVHFLDRVETATILLWQCFEVYASSRPML